MTSIGIIDEQGNTFIEQALKRLYAVGGKECPAIKSLTNTAQRIHRFDVLIINGNGQIIEEHLGRLESKGILIVNSDDKSIYQYLHRVPALLVTYGFSGKACVTASSVVDSEYRTIQCCIQRDLPTLSGSLICEQEFSVNFQTDSQDIHSLLGAITAALIDNVPLEKISANNLLSLISDKF